MFANRRSAGRELSGRLQHLRHEKPVVLALPRGGVPVGFEIAEELDAPLDIILVRKIGVPWQPELALGAVVDGADPQVIFNDKLAAELGIERDYIAGETARQLQEIERRRKIYLGDRPSSPLAAWLKFDPSPYRPGPPPYRGRPVSRPPHRVRGGIRRTLLLDAPLMINILLRGDRAEQTVCLFVGAGCEI
jgi:hypothetical protein